MESNAVTVTVTVGTVEVDPHTVTLLVLEQALDALVDLMRVAAAEGCYLESAAANAYGSLLAAFEHTEAYRAAAESVGVAPEPESEATAEAMRRLEVRHGNL